MVFDILHFAIILFLIGGAGFALGPLITAALISPRASGGDMGMPYECGNRPYGPAWTNFGISYYVYALLFIAFDVDVLYLFPVAAHYHLSSGLAPMFQVLGFLFFIVLALVYFQAKGVLLWPKKRTS